MGKIIIIWLFTRLVLLIVKRVCLQIPQRILILIEIYLVTINVNNYHAPTLKVFFPKTGIPIRKFSLTPILLNNESILALSEAFIKCVKEQNDITNSNLIIPWLLLQQPRGLPKTIFHFFQPRPLLTNKQFTFFKGSWGWACNFQPLNRSIPLRTI